MKTSFVRFFVNIWLILSEVPGWPDAPLAVRLSRVAPILIAALGVSGLLAWKHGWRDPAIAAARADHAPVVALEQEVGDLTLACSDQHAAEVAERAVAANALLVATHDDVTPLLRQLRDQIRAVGWEAVFQAYDAPVGDANAAEGIEFASVRGRLVPVAGNPAPFETLLGVFDQFTSGTKRIDLTRLGVRADEPGKLEVELNLRIACRAAHEKTS